MPLFDIKIEKNMEYMRAFHLLAIRQELVAMGEHCEEISVMNVLLFVFKTISNGDVSYSQM